MPTAIDKTLSVVISYKAVTDKLQNSYTCCSVRQGRLIVDKSYFYARENNARHREDRSSAVFFDAFVSVLALLMTLAMLMSPGSFAADYAYAGNETCSSVRVATFDQLSDALGNDEVSDIIIDPQAAKELADDKNTDGITFGGSDSFYIPVESPLVVSHDVTISSAEAVIFARSGNGGQICVVVVIATLFP